MPARFVIVTKDLSIKFFNQSYKIDDVGKAVWLGRDLSQERCKEIAEGLQELVDRGRYGTSHDRYTKGKVRPICIDTDMVEANILLENENLRDEVQDLEAEVTRLMYNGITLNGEM